MSSLHLVIFHLWQTDYSKIVHSLKLPILNVFKFHFISSFINLALTRCMLYRHHFNTLIPLLSLSLSARIGYPENTHRRRKYFCTASSQFDWFWFSSFSTYKLRILVWSNPIQLNWRPAVQQTLHSECSHRLYILFFYHS